MTNPSATRTNSPGYDGHYDTIAAIATSAGCGGIGIIRISGPDALKVADTLFRGKKKEPPSRQPTFTVRYGHVVAVGGEQIIDEVLLTVMRAPHSYTTQDTVEISCHAGPAVLRLIVTAALRAGCRLARAGEFTLRAFLSGRIDLTQAEAVLNVVTARSDAAAQAAVTQLAGSLSRRIAALQHRLLALCAALEAALDFPDGALDSLSGENRAAELDAALQDIAALLAGAQRGIAVQQGVRMALVGCPNVGKSSLLNALLDYDRCLVTPYSGTTRDVVEETVVIEGIPARLADTAGIIDSDCQITQESVQRTVAFLRQVDSVLFVVDAERAPLPADSRIAEIIAAKPVLVVVNKIDVQPQPARAALQALVPAATLVEVSARTGAGMSALKQQLAAMLATATGSLSDEVLVTTMRQRDQLRVVAVHVEQARQLIGRDAGEECVMFELRQALACLAQITGADVSEEVLSGIFSCFCIGK